jgi:hypothetical protein
MSNLQRVGSNTPASFQYYQIGFMANVPLGVVGNATATIPILSGGVTSNVGGNYIIRRITARNSNGSVAAANVSISGPLSGQITSSQGMGVITAAEMYLDFTLSATYVNSANATVTVTNPPTTTLLQDQFWNVNVLAAAAANNTVDIAIYGETVVG